MVTPSQLLLLTPGYFGVSGYFLVLIPGAKEFLQHRTSCVLTLPIERRERLHSGSVTHFLLHLQNRGSYLPPFQLIGLGKQNVDRQLRFVGEGHHLAVIIRKLAAYIDDQKQAIEALARLEVLAQQFAPVPPHRVRYACEAIARQVYETLPLSQTEKIDQLSPARCLACPCKLSPVDDDIDSAGLACV